MPSISGFSFIHNALAGGYPIVEAIMALQPFAEEIVVVDAASTDGTRDLLERIGQRLGNQLRILDAEWGDQAGQTLARLHAMNDQCRGDVVVHFEGDEVYDGMLLAEVKRRILTGKRDLAVHRLQIEQNGQRCRWYPWPVHRVFPPGSVVKVGETTDRHAAAEVIESEYGYLWDVTNWFRDHWVQRLDQQSQLRGGEPLNALAVPLHAAERPTMGDVTEWDRFFNQPHWTWTRSPFDLPGPLLRHVGKTKYEPGV